MVKLMGEAEGLAESDWSDGRGLSQVYNNIVSPKPGSPAVARH